MQRLKHAEQSRKDIIDNRRRKVKDHHEKIESRRKVAPNCQIHKIYGINNNKLSLITKIFVIFI